VDVVSEGGAVIPLSLVESTRRAAETLAVRSSNSSALSHANEFECEDTLDNILLLDDEIGHGRSFRAFVKIIRVRYG